MISGIGTYGLYAYAYAYATALFVLIAALATGQQQPPNVSKSVFVGDAQNQDPLAVLTSIPPPSGKEAPRTSALDLKIFAEDPDWAAKVRRLQLVVVVVSDLSEQYLHLSAHIYTYQC